MAGARIAAVAVHLPEQRLTNDDLAAAFPDWSVDKIAAKTGITERRIAGDHEFASDLAIGAGRALLDREGVDATTIDYLIVCTQTAELVMPAVSLRVHAALGMRSSAGATDITHGCSGYVVALGLATALIESRQAGRVLVITADTYSKLLNPADRSVRTIFGDGAAATLVDAAPAPGLRAFVYGSDGTGGGALVVPRGGIADGSAYPSADPAARGLDPSRYDLFMDGPGVFDFTLRTVPSALEDVLRRADVGRDDVDTWVFHQANAFMLGHLRRKLGLPEDRFVLDLATTGNTVSSTIPIALAGAMSAGRTPPGSRSVLLGFGVGLSWAGCVVDW